VTNPERFRPLHSRALELLVSLEDEYVVTRLEGRGVDPDLEGDAENFDASIRLVPDDGEAAPVGVVLSSFPGLFARFGQWHVEPFPPCGCDACDDDVDDVWSHFRDRVDDVVAGRFYEELRLPLVGDGWLVERFWSSVGSSSGRSRIARSRAKGLRARAVRSVYEWRPWRRR
jgi:hypothetical protein